MSNLVEQIKSIQRAVGVMADGKFGPASAGAVLKHLAQVELVDVSAVPAADLDERTLNNIATLDPKAREAFIQFSRLAKATAATLGCDYVMISGNRTYADQNTLYAQGRTEPGKIVTNAKGGQSNHNFAIAADFGVFRGKAYLDVTDPPTAAKVHRACSEHAAACGLEWGGAWTSLIDLPHYEIKTGLTMAQKRTRYEKTGSVL